MTAKRYLVIAKVPFGLDGTHRTRTVDDKAIRFPCLLESLQAAP